MTEQKVDKLESEMRSEIKSFYKAITSVKEKITYLNANINHLVDNVKKLNDYTHERIHYLLNTDKGVELKLTEVSERLNTLEDFKKSTNESSNNLRAKTIDYTFKLFSGILFIILGMLLKGYAFH